MFKISNIRIGTKLAIISGLGVLLVVAMIAIQTMGSMGVRDANQMSTRQQKIVQQLTRIDANMRVMMINFRDMLLSRTPDEARKFVAKQEETFTQTKVALDEVFGMMLQQANRDQLQATRPLLDKYTAHTVAAGNQKADHLARRSDSAFSAADEAAFDQALLQTLTTGRGMVGEILKSVGEMSGRATASAAKGLETSETTSAQAQAFSLVAGLIAVAVLIGSVFFGIFTIARPLRQLVGPLDRIASGDFKVVIPGMGRKDEVGQISSAVGAMAQRVSATILEIKASGREVTNASAEISVATTDLSQRTEEQAASLEETSAAMEELSATVKKNAENAQQASVSALSTQDVAARGGEVVSQAVDAMSRIEDSSRKISDIIGVIDEIARQTNLLALNAAVEAARAGEAGRGFAVVASEVRSLAQRSSQAAKDIKDLITNSNGQVQEGVELVNRAGESLHEIVASIKNVATIVSDIANASIEQATGLEQINKALSQMDEVTQQNSALVEENAATAKTLEHQAKAMDDQVAFFQIDEHAEIKTAVGDGITRTASRPAAPRPAPVRVSKPAAIDPEVAQRAVAGRRGGPVGRMHANLATAVKDEWQEF